MSLVRYNIIGTGSQGNATVLNDWILIDCGMPYKAIKSEVKNLKLVLLSHAHQDHLNKQTIRKLAFERPTLRFGCCKWLVEALVDCNVNKNAIDVYEPNEVYDYKLFQISPVELIHDVPNCGYKIHFSNEKVFYATDTNSLDGIDAEGYDLYMVEANYDDTEISERIQRKVSHGDYAYEFGVLNNHLSKAKCDEFLQRNMSWNSEFIYMHQHVETNKNNKEESEIF